MTDLLKHWEKLLAISGIVFYTGAWFQRSASSAQEAANAATIVAVQGQLNQLVQVTNSNSDQITKLIAITAAQQEALNSSSRHSNQGK